MKYLIATALLFLAACVFAEIPTAKEANAASKKAQIENMVTLEAKLKDEIRNAIREAEKKGEFKAEVSIGGYPHDIIDKVKKYLEKEPFLYKVDFVLYTQTPTAMRIEWGDE